MRIVNFKGGLGNQIFEYVFSLYLQRMYPKEHIYGCYWSKSLRDHSDFVISHVFDINLPKHTILTDFVSRCAYILERFRIVSMEETDNSIFFNGYWLDKKYWENIDLCEALPFRIDRIVGEGHDKSAVVNVEKCGSNETASVATNDMKRVLGEYNTDLLCKIRKSDSVSVHIRRGDYLSAENKDKFGDFCPPGYYSKAVDYERSMNPSAKFFVFSDDIAWCEENLGLDSATYVQGNDGNSSWIDMYLMSKCKHNIIANSTFSFWGAMLNSNLGKRVYYPSKWYIWDNPVIFPDDWISISV